MSASITLQGTISCVDSSTGAVPFVKQVDLVMAGTCFDVVQGQVIGTIGVSIPLPISPTQFVYLANLSTGNTVTVAWTPNGGFSGTQQTLGPGKGLFIVNQLGIGVTGITALTLIASASNTPIEYVLGG